MKNIILLFLFSFFSISCKEECKSSPILIVISYVGNQDRPYEEFLVNYDLKMELNSFESIYKVENSCGLRNVRDYIIAHNSKNTHKINKLKLTIIENNDEKKIFFFDAPDGLKFINYLEKEVQISSQNLYYDDKYFKRNVLPSLRNQLKKYQGKEWMSE